MVITKLKIDAFGVLRNREIELCPSLNIIEGENESGKSALAMFIKFMFYGLSGKSSGGDLSERRRYVNWDTGSASGSMLLLHHGREIRIERTLTVSGVDDGARTRENVRESVRVCDTETNTLIHLGEIPGEALLGVPESIFMNTVFIRQIDGTRPGGSGILASIENLLFSANEQISTEKAVDRLDEARRQLLHKNENGGLIFEKKTERSQLAAELETARSIDTSLRDSEKELNEALQDRTELEEQILRQEKICACGEVNLYKRRFDTLHSAARKLNEMYTDLKAQSSDGIDRAYLNQLDECRSRISEYRSDLEKIRIAETELNTRIKEASLKEDQIERETDDVLTLYESLHSRKRSMTAAALTLFFFAALMGFAVWVLFTFRISLYPVPAAAALILAVLGGICLMLRGRAAARQTELLGEWDAPTPEHLPAAILKTLGGDSGFTALQNEKNKLDTISAETQSKLREEVQRALNLCAKVTEIPDTDSDGDDDELLLGSALRVLETAISSAGEKCARLEALRREADTLAGRLSLLKEQLSDADEAEIRQKFAENMKTAEGRIASGMDAARLEAARHELAALREKQKEYVERHHRLDTQVAASRAVSASPVQLAEQLERLDSEIELMNMRHEAYCLAIETVMESARSVRAGVLPQIVRDACASANRISDGRFEAIGIDQELSMSFTRNGKTRGIEYLSEGTKDLAYISLRRALTQALFTRDCPPLIYDESFARVDEHRLSRILDLLRETEGEHSQSIVLSCRRLEAELALQNGGAAVIRL